MRREREKATGWKSPCDKNINLASHAFFSLSPWQQDRNCASIVYSVHFNSNNLSSKTTHIQMNTLKLQCMYMAISHNKCFSFPLIFTFFIHVQRNYPAIYIRQKQEIMEGDFWLTNHTHQYTLSCSFTLAFITCYMLQ